MVLYTKQNFLLQRYGTFNEFLINGVVGLKWLRSSILYTYYTRTNNSSYFPSSRAATRSLVMEIGNVLYHPIIDL